MKGPATWIMEADTMQKRMNRFYIVIFVAYLISIALAIILGIFFFNKQ